MFVVTCLALGYLGSLPAEGVYVMWARIFTAYYFAFFLLIMPFLSLWETPTRMPGSISEAVLGKDAPNHAAGGGAPAAANAEPEKR